MSDTKKKKKIVSILSCFIGELATDRIIEALDLAKEDEMKQQISVEDLGKKKAEELFDEWIKATGSGELTQDVKPINVSIKDRSDFIKIVGHVLADYEDLSRGKTDIIFRQSEELEKIDQILMGGNDFNIPSTHLYLEQVLNDLDDLMDWLDKFYHDPNNDQIIFKMREAAKKLIKRFPERAWSGSLYCCPKCLSKVETHNITLERIGYTCKKCHTVFHVDREETPLKP